MEEAAEAVVRCKAGGLPRHALQDAAAFIFRPARAHKRGGGAARAARCVPARAASSRSPACGRWRKCPVLEGMEGGVEYL